MVNQNCQYSQYKKTGLEQSLTCSLTGKYCIKQRYCPTQRRLVNTDDWQTCTHLDKEELQMANKKTTAKKKVDKKDADIKKVTEPTIEKEETIVTTESVEPVVEKVEYEVILAKPTYFIIDKNGFNERINKMNNYKKGDKVTL